MVDILIGIFEAIGGYLSDFTQASTKQKIVFFIILIGIIAILIAVLIISFKYSPEI